MQKILITGATGCVGANLVETVTEAGLQAIALRRKNSSLRALEGLKYQETFGDVSDYESLVTAMRGVEYVCHAAAVADYWRADMHKMFEVNVEGTRNVMRAAQATGVRRVVFVSSVASLGQPEFGKSADENSVFNLPSERWQYGYSKLLAEQVVQEFVVAGLDAVIVNPAVVIGPRDVNLISGSIIIEETKFGVPVYPPGGVCVIDVADVCAAIKGAISLGRTGHRYVLGGDNLWYRDLIAQTAQVVGRQPARIPISRGMLYGLARLMDATRSLGLKLPANGDQMRFTAETLWFDSAKARRELGLSTRPYRETAQRAFEWYKMKGYI